MLHVYPPPYFWILHIDGSAKPNPGRMAIGLVLSGPDGTEMRQSLALPGTGCNNEAEARALLQGLQLALQHGASHLRIYTDSHWLLEQLAPPAVPGQKVRPTQRLLPWLMQLRQLLQAVPQVQWRWIPRHCNTEADALAYQVYEEANN